MLSLISFQKRQNVLLQNFIELHRFISKSGRILQQLMVATSYIKVTRRYSLHQQKGPYIIRQYIP
jgi:hypothetical protein